MSAADTAPGFRDWLARGEGAQVVAFRMSGQLHGCDIRLVEEVVTKQRIHPLPDVPAHLLGMLLLRGEMVPVVDVSAALGLPLTQAQPPVLVAGVGEARVGVAVDAVFEVMDVPGESLRPAPYTGGERDAYVVAVARMPAGLVTLIDLAEILRERTTLETGEQP